MTARKAGTLFFLMVLFYFACSGAISFFGPWYGFLRRPMVLLLASEAAILYPVLVFAVLAPEPLSRIFPLRRVNPLTGVLAVLSMICLYPAIAAVNLLTLQVTENAASAVAGMTKAMPMWQMVLAVGVIGPLCEELAFRGYILQALRSAGKPAAAVIISAFLFGLIHLNLNQACYAFAFGLALALVALGTESILPGFIMHMVLNSAQVIFLYMGLTEAGPFTRAEILEQTIALAPWAAGGLVLFVLLLLAMRALEKTERERAKVPAAADARILGPGLILGCLAAGGFILVDFLDIFPFL